MTYRFANFIFVKKVFYFMKLINDYRFCKFSCNRALISYRGVKAFSQYD